MTSLACDPTMIFMAAALANVEKKLDAIQDMQKEMMDFLVQKEKADLKGDLNFLFDVFNNYKYNWNNEMYKNSNNGAVFIVALILVFCWILNIKPISSLLKNIIESENKSDKIVSAIIWVFNLCVLTLPTYIGKVWEYLSSDKRREKLCSKYFKQQIKMFDDK